ncbi:kinase domain protein [Ceratobasidium sp. AG-Ba]|nr:kinase domain protein [Ceratobasidium sp. AG-Ba]
MERLNRGPKGMIADLYLHARHSLKHPSESRTPPKENQTPGTQPSLPPGLDSEGSPCTSNWDLVARNTRKKVDFRTGTPTFMSARVLDVPIGQPYKHHFLDDLESFFWLLLCLTAAHLDSGMVSGTRVAHGIIDGLDQNSLDNIRSYKNEFMHRCSKSQGNLAKKLLEGCKNTWARDPAICTTIIKLGAYFDFVDLDLEGNTYPPEVDFSAVVDIAWDALGLPKPAAGCL